VCDGPSDCPYSNCDTPSCGMDLRLRLLCHTDTGVLQSAALGKSQLQGPVSEHRREVS
jgi:hypothetical protein